MDAWLWIVAALAAAAFIQGYAGFGFGIISLTVLALMPLDLERMAAVVNLAVMPVMALLLHWSLRDNRLRWESWLGLTVGSLLGVPCGYVLLERFGDMPEIRAALGGLVILFALHGYANKRPLGKMPAWAGYPMGVFSGLLGGAFLSGGPPVVLYLYSQTDDPREMKATLQAYFLWTAVYRIVWVGRSEAGFGGGILPVAAVAMAVVVPLLFLGHRLARKSSPERFRKAVYALMALIGLLAVVRGIAP